MAETIAHAPTETEAIAPPARIVRVSGQMVDLKIEGEAPRVRDLFVGIDDADLRIEVATLPSTHLARGLVLSTGQPVALGARLRARYSIRPRSASMHHEPFKKSQRCS